jgi:hypothetical protein
MNICLIEQTQAKAELEVKKAEVEFEDNSSFKAFHKAIVTALKCSDDKVATVASFQKLLDFESAFFQYQLDFSIPYPDKTMSIVDEFLVAMGEEKAADNTDVLDMVEESPDDLEDELTVADAVKVDSTTPSTKKGFFSFT